MNLQKQTKYIISIVLTVSLSYWLIYAWNSWLTVNPWNSLTSESWNKVIQNIETNKTNITTNSWAIAWLGWWWGSLFTQNWSDIYYNTGNVWVWTNNITNKLTVQSAWDSTSPFRVHRPTWSWTYLLDIAQLADGNSRLDMQGAWWISKIRIETDWDTFFNWGNVWIWTETPWSKLDVRWWLRVSDWTNILSLYQYSWNHILEWSSWELNLRAQDWVNLVDNWGKVWIWHTSPNEILDIKWNYWV